MARKKNPVKNWNNFISNEEFNMSALDNKRSWVQYHDKLTELAVSMFEWKNLPDGIDPIFLERVLFFDGKILFFKEDVLNKFVVMRFNGSGNFDIYNVPINRQAYSTPNGFTANLTNENSVIIYNNMIRKPSTLDMQIFSKRLYEIDRTIDTNIKAQKTPILILCDEKQRLTLKNMYMQYDGNQPVIYGDKTSLNPNSLQVLQTGAPFLADNLMDLKNRIFNEALTYLGISNINTQKKERMITDEVTRNQGATIANRYSRLEARRRACQQINAMFGLNITCDFREDYRMIDELEYYDNQAEESEPDSSSSKDSTNE